MKQIILTAICCILLFASCTKDDYILQNQDSKFDELNNIFFSNNIDTIALQNWFHQNKEIV